MRRELAILGIGGISGLLYVVVHFSQESLFSSGPAFVGTALDPWANPANNGRLLLLLASYTLAIAALLVLYDRVVAWCQAGLESARARWLALLLPVVFYIGYLPTPPYFAADVYSYVAFGYVGNLPGGNPYLQEAWTILSDPFGQQLAALGWQGSGLSPYGPVWNDIESAIVRLTRDASQAVFATKTLVVLATFGSALVVASILRRVRPDAVVAGTAALLWNPALVVLVAGEGHNDAFMLLLILAALELTVRPRIVGGVLVQLLAVLTKYLPVVLLPMQIAYWFRTEPNRSRLAVRLGLGGLLGLGLAALLYQPVWVGPGTFMGTGALGDGSPRVFDLPGALGLLARYVAVAGAVLIGGWHARDARRLLQACAGVMLVAVLLGPQKFWPWYAVVPVGLMALSPATFRWTTLVLSACALVLSLVLRFPLYPNGLVRPELQTLVYAAARGLPFLSLMGVWIVTQKRRRTVDRLIQLR